MNIYDISVKAGVSIATVSRILNNSPRVGKETRERVLAVMEECGYVPNVFARGLGLNSMKTIGLLCPNAADNFQAKALSHLEFELRQKEYNCLLVCCGRTLEGRVHGLEQLVARRVDGIILMGSPFVEDRDEDNDYIRKAASQIPIIMMNAFLPAKNVYSVMCDQERNSEEAARYLIETGCRKILYLYHSRSYNGQKKLAGYRAALQKAGIPEDESLIHFFPEDTVSVPGVHRYLDELYENGLRFDAVYTSEDELAAAAVKFANGHGFRIPEDLSVIGYNNSSDCLLTEPELSSVDIKLESICRTSVQILLSVLEGNEMPQTTIFAGNIVNRGSTRQIS